MNDPIQPGDRSAHDKRSTLISPPNAHRDIPAHWRWHYQALGRLCEKLVQERQRALREGAERIEIDDLHPADSASDEFNHEIVLSQLSAEQDAIYEVEAAMQRIKLGTYGICERTGRPIPPERLKVVPWTRFTEEVAASLEKLGENPHRHLGSLRSVQGNPATALAAGEAALEQAARGDTLPRPGADQQVDSAEGL